MTVPANTPNYIRNFLYEIAKQADRITVSSPNSCYPADPFSCADALDEELTTALPKMQEALRRYEIDSAEAKAKAAGLI